MNKSHQFKLIQGTFVPADAAEILLDMISNKIRFHSLQNFGSRERNGKDIPHSQKRVAALKKMEQSLRKIFDSAEKKNHQLVIEGTIDIRVLAD